MKRVKRLRENENGNDYKSGKQLSEDRWVCESLPNIMIIKII